MLFVASCVDKGEGSGASAPSEFCEARALVFELREVAPAELGEPAWVVREPLSQLGARRQLLVPLVELGTFLGDPPWPKPVDKHAVAV